MKCKSCGHDSAKDRAIDAKVNDAVEAAVGPVRRRLDQLLVAERHRQNALAELQAREKARDFALGCEIAKD
jgi:hypothetical protein